MIRIWLAFLALMIAAPVAAHQQKVTITSVEHNARTGLIEVVHRVPLHDAEHALRRQGLPAADIIEDGASRRAFARYVSERFSIEAAGEDIAFTLLGSEVEGGYLLIYQEAPSPGAGSQLAVRSAVLTDIWSRQTNRVNVGSGTSPQTLIFRPGDRAKVAVLR